MEEDQVFFEISDTGSFVRVTPLETRFHNVELDWDKNWIKVRIEIKSGAFYGNYIAELQTIDFVVLKEKLSHLYNNLKGAAKFEDIEGYLTLDIKGDGIGHFEVNCIANDQPGIYGTKLEFDLFFDQTQIPQLSRQLDVITDRYPVIGNFWNK